MRNYGQMQDLLHSQRRRRGRRRWLLRLVMMTAAVGTAGYVWMTYFSGGSTDKEQREIAVERVQSLVHQSLEAAHRPLEVDAPDPKEQSEKAEWDANWKKGEPVKMRGKLKKHQSVFEALQKRDLPSNKIQAVVTATSETFDFRKSRPGDEWSAEVESSGTITRFRYKTSPEDIWETVRNSNGEYSSTKIDVPVETRQRAVAGRVDRSLWESIVEEADEPKLVYRFADIFAYSVDFNRETQPGDTFAMVIEKVYLDGEFLRYGNILAAEYVNQGERFRGYFYEKDEETSAYYTGEWKNLKRQFLKSPLASIRVTSSYGMRYHPTLGRKKMHRGVDYGAPTGTPVRAVADATVSYAGYKGANGNLIVLRHANGYTTLYAHLSDIADGIRTGKKISKKTVIGEVGSTGRSTGPHLHFGMKQHGRYVNPKDVDSSRAEPLGEKERKKFRSEVVESLEEKLESVAIQPPGVDPVNLAKGGEGN